MNENRKKKIPGISDNLKALSQYKDEIQQIQDNIQLYKSKIHQDVMQQKVKSGRALLFDTKEVISDEIKQLYEKREKAFNEKTSLFNKIQEVRASLKGQKHVSLGELEKRKKAIEMRMMHEQYNSQQEKEYQTQLLELKKMRSLVGDNQGREVLLDNLEKDLNEVKKRLEAINADLSGRKKEMEELKVEIDNLKEKERSKSGAVIGYEEKIDELKKRREELLEKKKKELDEIKRKEEEYDAYLAEMASQMEIENKKKEQKNKIKKLVEQLNVLEEQKNNFDPKKYDALIDAISKMKNLNNIPMSIIQKLGEEKLGIPMNQEDLKKIISELEKKKVKFGSEVGNKLGSFNEKIKKLSDEIDEEKKILSEMPETEVRIERERKVTKGF